MYAMAKRTTAKSYKKPEAKTHKKPKAPKKKTTPTLNSVCVVSITPFDPALETAFKAGLNAGANPPAYKKPLDNKGYNLATLKAAVKTAAGTGKTLVVTVGGLAAAQGAEQSGTTIPFISIAGGVTGFYSKATKNFKGGYNLNSLSNDAAYITHLVGLPNIARTDICLLYNSNSIIAQLEPNTFTKTQSVAVDQNTNTLANAKAAFTGAFAQMAATYAKALPKAVVVSGDAFFAYWREALISVANPLNQYHFLYPSSIYQNTNGTAPQHCTIYPFHTDLANLYGLLGSMAASVVGGQTASYQTIPLGSPNDIP
jgi:hypothetical protein